MQELLQEVEGKQGKDDATGPYGVIPAFCQMDAFQCKLCGGSLSPTVHTKVMTMSALNQLAAPDQAKMKSC